MASNFDENPPEAAEDGIPPTGIFPAVNIEDEVKESFLAYSMSVIVSRALPDVRDGLKPVHRRILYAMFREGLLPSRPYSKCAGVVGEVLKHYHPHGDSAVYDALVRMVQEFSLRYPLIDGQGNFGSIDGDSAAAYRYTESRLHPIAEETLRDIDRDTVDFAPNFDGSMEEPTVLPTRLPQLLANGSTGIAVGMATNIPPHNINELVDGLLFVADNPDCTIDELIEIIPAPDFPTGALICGMAGVRSAYTTGRGHIRVRARTSVEETKRGQRLVITEIPYQVNKAAMVERIADLVRDGRLTGISDLRDESNRQGMRVVVELKRDASPEIVLNMLYKHTPLQSTFAVNMLALVNGRPQLLNIKQILQYFIEFRREVVTRRASFELAQAEARAHLLEGFEIALDHLDEVIALIRASADTATARDGLIERFGFSERQAQAILEMRLRALTALERDKVLNELAELRAKIADLRDLLESPQRILAVVVDETKEMKERFGDARRTEVTAPVEGFTEEDLITEEEMVVTISHLGYIKRNAATDYRAQRRGGKGVTGMKAREEDFVEHLFTASTHATIMFFTNRGRVHWLKVYELPKVGRAARGKALINALQLSEGERVQTVFAVRDYADIEDQYMILCTAKGTIKKTSIKAFSSPRRGGIIAINLDGNDELISACRSDGNQDVVIASRQGKAIHFPEGEVRPMGRAAGGVRGIRLADSDVVVGMEVLSPGSDVLTVTTRGYGKRTPLSDYRIQKRGGQGIITMRTNDRIGAVIGVLQVVPGQELMLITDYGKVLRCEVGGISSMGRATQGVRIMAIAEDESIVSIARLADPEDVDPAEPAPPADPAEPAAPAESPAPAETPDDAGNKEES